MKNSLLLSLALSTFTLSANASIVPEGYNPFQDYNLDRTLYNIELKNAGPQECEEFANSNQTDVAIVRASNIVNIRMKQVYDSYVDQNLQFEKFEEDLLDSIVPAAFNISDAEQHCDFLKKQQSHYINNLGDINQYYDNDPNNDKLGSYAYNLMKAIKINSLYYSTSLYQPSKSQDDLYHFGFYFENNYGPSLDIDNVLINRITNAANYRISKANENKDLVSVDIQDLQDAVDNLHYLTIQLVPLTGYERNKYGKDNYELFNILDNLLDDVEKTSYLINFNALDDTLREDGLILNLNMLNIGVRSDYKNQFLNDFYSFKTNTAVHMSQKNLQRSINNHAQYLIETYGDNSKYTSFLLDYINRYYENRPY
jgi:hypothetical protein